MTSVLDSYTWLAIQYQQTNIQDLLQNISAIQQQYQSDIIDQYSDKFDIDTANGVWLDYVGYKLGVLNRPSTPIAESYFGFENSGGMGFNQEPFINSSADTIPFTDEEFRAFLKAKAQQLITDCTPESIRDALLLFFDDVTVIDNQDMTTTIIINSSRPLAITLSAIESGIVTKPAAVRMYIQIVFGNHFGFENSGGTGFNQSPFLYTIIT